MELPNGEYARDAGNGRWRRSRMRGLKDHLMEVSLAVSPRIVGEKYRSREIYILYGGIHGGIVIWRRVHHACERSMTTRLGGAQNAASSTTLYQGGSIFPPRKKDSSHPGTGPTPSRVGGGRVCDTHSGTC